MIDGTTDKFLALKGLSNRGAHLGASDDGEWYMAVEGVEIKDTPSTAGALVGRGRTPEQAVMDCWKNATSRLTADQYVVVDGLRDTRAAYRWNGTRWAPVQEPGRA